MPRRRPSLPAPGAEPVARPRRRRLPARLPARLSAGLLAWLLALATLLPALAQPAHAQPSTTPSTPTATPSSPTAGQTPEESVEPTPEQTTPGGDPLRLQIDELTPSVPRADEQVQITGTITNESQEEWTTINVHAFHGVTPILDAASLAAAAASDEDEVLGPRVVEPGTFQTIPSLQPGESAPFTAFIPAGVLAGGDGVYWAGVHALGQTESVLRDANTDGRARTFLPVLSGERQRLDAALVLPLRAPVLHTRAGRIANPARWAELLGPGGRLRNLLEAGRSAGDRPVTWLLDPAVAHAAMRLAAGNPRVTLSPPPGQERATPEESDGENGEDGGDETGGETPDGGATGTPAPDGTVLPLPAPTEPGDDGADGEPGDGAEEGEPDPAVEAAAAAAEGWLELFEAEMAAHPVLALPYGDVDASALQRHDPGLLATAREWSTSVLSMLGVTATPVLAGPDGFLSPDAVRASSPETVMLLTDRALQDPSGRVPSTGTVLGRTFATTSSGVAAGGPGPEPAAGPVAVRQRVVSEAALRLLSGDASPLVIAPPPSWDPATGSAVLFSTFDEGLLRLQPLARLVGSDVLVPPPAADGLVEADELPPEALVYGEAQVDAELPAASVRAATRRLERARLLDGVLTRGSVLVPRLVEAVLPSTSYFARRRPEAWRERNLLGTDWLQGKLQSVRVETPLRATLSSDHGTLGVTLVNDLDVAVTVRIAASSQGGLQIEEHEPVTVTPRSRRLLRLSASATREGTDELTLRVTDVDGTPLGASATYPVRTSQVSGTLWVIMAVGAALLFGTIGVRFLRGNRRTRLEQAEAEAEAAAAEAAGTAQAPGASEAEPPKAPAPAAPDSPERAEQAAP